MDGTRWPMGRPRAAAIGAGVRAGTGQGQHGAAAGMAARLGSAGRDDDRGRMDHSVQPGVIWTHCAIHICRGRSTAGLFFAALFIAAYFAWVWISTRKG